MRVMEIRSEATGASDKVDLDFDDRTRRRAMFTTYGGKEIVLDQAHSHHLRGGQAFVLEDGSVVEIAAKPEPLLAIRCADGATLVKIAWHLGNRHLATQIKANGDGGELRIRQDHVIEAMATGLGGICHHLDAPFDPEGGAYGHQHAAAQGHSHDHQHGQGGHTHDD
jgi:urease accessory protein